jgi:zinc/manganese transport system substrate-binding protein
MNKILASLALLISLTPALAFAEGKPVEVVATFSILGDLAKQVGGDLVHVKTLVGPDGDAHTYKPTPGDSVSLSEADLVIENGLHMEGWVDRLVSASGFKGNVVIASEGVTPRQMDAEEEEASHSEGGKVTDPHAWQDISNTRIYVKNIAEALAKTRPADAETFRLHAKAYDAELEKLDTWVKAELGSIPTEQRKIVTSHDAFGYFGAAYGVTFLAPQGISTEVEPTATQVAKLIEQMKSEKVKRIFFENMASPKLVKQLAKDAGASVGRPVYSDALSKVDGDAATYVALFRHNIAQFKDAMTLNGQ